MSKTNLEARSNEIVVLSGKARQKLKITNIEGQVIKVNNIRGDQHRNYLNVHLKPETQKEGIMLYFYGTSPVRGGDKIRAGIILDEEFSLERERIGDAFYIEIIDERSHYLRRDFRDECEGPWFERDLGLEA